MNLCVIPARGASKRIPKKNIKLFCGKPLIYYSIKTALKSGLFERVVVSTDDEEVANISKKYGAKVQMRPKELADDHTGTGEVVEYVTNSLKKRYDFVCTICATAPFLKEKYLKEGYEKEFKNMQRCHLEVFKLPIYSSLTKKGKCK